MTIQEARDDLETAILLAMSATQGRIPDRPRKSSGRKEEVSTDFFCRVPPEYPRHAYALSPQPGRLYAAHPSQLICDPIQVAREGLETCLLVDGKFLWKKICPMKPPKTVVALTNRKPHWFAVHCREIDETGKQDYSTQPVALNDDGAPAPLKFVGWQGTNSAVYQREQAMMVAIMFSIYEDAMRANAYLATVQEGVKLSFAVGEDAYLEFFRDRDGWRETPTQRRNPILHWCARHLRGANATPVKAHKRGREEVLVGPMRLTIEPTPWSARQLVQGDED